jgi:hypothetical protein
MMSTDERFGPDDDALDGELLAQLRQGETPPPRMATNALAARILAQSELPLRRRARERDAVSVIAQWSRVVLPFAAAAGIVLALNLAPASDTVTASSADTWSLLDSGDGTASSALVEDVVSSDDPSTTTLTW